MQDVAAARGGRALRIWLAAVCNFSTTPRVTPALAFYESQWLGRIQVRAASKSLMRHGGRGMSTLGKLLHTEAVRAAKAGWSEPTY